MHYNNKIALKSQTIDILFFIINKLKLDNILIDEICICNIESGIWINNNSNNGSYFQEYFSKCL